jgi:hypothetical protein
MGPELRAMLRVVLCRQQPDIGAQPQHPLEHFHARRLGDTPLARAP